MCVECMCSVYRVYVVHVCAGGVLCACVALRSVYSVHVVRVCTECMCSVCVVYTCVQGVC